ncbi:MAG TPA: hypothetical protein EYG66_00145 [Mariprofundaceae bacterium]|nr:hypothetical protein [Mariprofundaceae bacterium]
MNEAFSFILIATLATLSNQWLTTPLDINDIFIFIIVWQLTQLFFLSLEANPVKQKKSTTKNQSSSAPFPESTTSSKPQSEAKLQAQLIIERDIWQAKQASVLSPSITISTSGSDIDIAVQATREIEQLLEKKLGAYGKGLHSKLSSVEAKIPSDIVKSMRWIATIRNNTMHRGAVMQNKEDYANTANNIITYLQSI